METPVFAGDRKTGKRLAVRGLTESQHGRTVPVFHPVEQRTATHDIFKAVHVVQGQIRQAGAHLLFIRRVNIERIAQMKGYHHTGILPAVEQAALHVP